MRVEEEIEIEPDRFERLWPLTEGLRIEKTRYEIDAGDGLVIELDVYKGDLDGPRRPPRWSSTPRRRPTPSRRPTGSGDDVTEDVRYKNQRLARDGAP